MNFVNKSFLLVYVVCALAATSVVLIAHSETELEQAKMPTVSLVKTLSNKYSGLDPQTVNDVNGNTTAVWEEYDGTRFNIWTMRRAAGESWSTASLLETENAGDAYSPQIAVDGIGNVTAVWKQSDGKRFSIYANRYANSTGWEGVKQIESGIATQVSAGAPLVTYDASGYAMVAWQEVIGLNTKTWVNNHFGAAGWGAAKQLIANTTRIDYPHFELDKTGMVTIVAQKSEDGNNLAAIRKTVNDNGYKQVSIYSKRAR